MAERISELVRWDQRKTLPVFMARVVTLASYWMYLSQKYLAALRNTSQSRVSRVLRRIEPILIGGVDEWAQKTTEDLTGTSPRSMVY
ncbi:hypothetical protein SAMN04487905_1282 [Actinopolyspora xinjiangensis]|uniref:Helix-turn-helix of DDE superfamily endonuclease n=1 Tax=Actinopolyspora xinjiangensis TaxID=405564 RepID=A0A1H0X385_9ACTN|nr:hypothetical protein SAMN04487905_1282 [Actinopolyspora xinjiangensis]